MTATVETLYDVFLTHGILDRGVAAVVERAFAEAGLEVYVVHDVKPGDAFLSELRKAVAECSAFVVILTRSTLHSQDVPFEVGMALAWNKPIFVLYDGVSHAEVPSFLRDFKVRPLSELPQVVRDIVEVKKPLSDRDRDTLVEVYCEFEVPTDRLLGKPLALRQLAEEYNKRTGSNVGGEKLVQELIRLRKQGKLPAIKKGA